jgi:UDP-N-acetylglucosamine--N-acetylmuramyl-(pentapeptide) pyrophosphoryl-undecaprenol N-acetylglucosamine transferase
MSHSQRPVLIMAGGTGGHVFPALAVAEHLQAAGMAVAWLGTRNGLEARVVPPTGIPVYWIKVSGLRGKGLQRLLVAPFMLFWALVQAMWLMIRLRPVAVLGMGGFVTGPGGFMAWLLRRPLLIHEQNSVAGLTNRLLAPLANCVMEAFPGSLKHAVHMGNPVRTSLLSIAEEKKFTEQRALRLLVVGGSLGASVFNETVPKVLHNLGADCPDVWHQTGLKHLEAAQQAYQDAAIEARIEPFIDDIAVAYQWADLVLCRAGAMTIAELAVMGVASILVPYPYAVDDHQTGNARYLSGADAAVLIPQPEFTEQRLTDVLRTLSDPEKLTVMGHKARQLALPDAAQRVADRCLQLSGQTLEKAA